VRVVFVTAAYFMRVSKSFSVFLACLKVSLILLKKSVINVLFPVLVFSATFPVLFQELNKMNPIFSRLLVENNNLQHLYALVNLLMLMTGA